MTIPFDQSPNYTKGRKEKIKHIIIHAMSGSFVGSKAWFKNPKSKVSAHYLVSQKGDVLQMVKDTDTAWHCYGVNSKSIGIELEDGKPGACLKDDKWITQVMLEKAAMLTAELTIKYNISVDNVLGHNEPWIQKINPSYAHYDPGKLDMVKFRELVRECRKKIST